MRSKPLYPKIYKELSETTACWDSFSPTYKEDVLYVFMQECPDLIKDIGTIPELGFKLGAAFQCFGDDAYYDFRKAVSTHLLNKYHSLLSSITKEAQTQYRNDHKTYLACKRAFKFGLLRNPDFGPSRGDFSYDIHT